MVHDPMYSKDEITQLGLDAYELNEKCDGVIIQANHSEYENLVSENFPGVQFLVDGRNSANENLKSKIPFAVIGIGLSD
jgi:UDP-N-acetyl-D-mannosaminuronate dehydrogenase